MKKLLPTVILLLQYFLAFSQEKETLLQSTGKTHHYVVAIGDTAEKLYNIGRHWDKAGSGFSLRGSDTLLREAGGDYTGRSGRITKNVDGYTFTGTDQRKDRILHLGTVTNLPATQLKLNNGYFLDSYFKMSAELNASY